MREQCQLTEILDDLIDFVRMKEMSAMNVIYCNKKTANVKTSCRSFLFIYTSLKKFCGVIIRAE
jgi:hypothetical protein